MKAPPPTALVPVIDLWWCVRPSIHLPHRRVMANEERVKQSLSFFNKKTSYRINPFSIVSTGQNYLGAAFLPLFENMSYWHPIAPRWILNN